jgi:hypothetical protein
MSYRLLRWGSALGAALVATVFASALASAQPARVKVGTLTCAISPGVGMIVASQRGLQCTYTPAVRGRRERYVGSITRVGLDLGATAGGTLVWAVYAPTARRWRRGGLAGSYGGASGEASIGAGLGANVLVGGSNRTIALQPLSVQGQVGVNLALGVANLELRPAR